MSKWIEGLDLHHELTEIMNKQFKDIEARMKEQFVGLPITHTLTPSIVDSLNQLVCRMIDEYNLPKDDVEFVTGLYDGIMYVKVFVGSVRLVEVRIS